MSHRRLVFAMVAAFVAVPALALPGCGGGSSTSTATASAPQVDRQQIQSLISSRVHDRTPALAIGAVTCPQGIQALQGVNFQCTVLVEGEPVGYQVTVTRVAGDQASYDIQALQTVVDVGSVVSFVRGLLDDQWRSAVIDCGKAKARVVAVGTTIDCTVFNGRTTRYIQVTVDDKDGALRAAEK